MRQRAAVSGFRINELNAAAPVLLTMTRTGRAGSEESNLGIIRTCPRHQAAQSWEQSSGVLTREATLVALRAPCAPR